MKDLNEREIKVLEFCGKHLNNGSGEMASSIWWWSASEEMRDNVIFCIVDLYNKGYVTHESTSAHMIFTAKGLQIIKLLESYNEL